SCGGCRGARRDLATGSISSTHHIILPVQSPKGAGEEKKRRRTEEKALADGRGWWRTSRTMRTRCFRLDDFRGEVDTALQQSNGSEHEEAATRRVYAGRAIGGYRHHCGADRHPAAGAQRSPGIRPPSQMRQQSEEFGTGTA